MFIVVLGSVFILHNLYYKDNEKKDDLQEKSSLTGTILEIKEDVILLEDENRVTYSIPMKEMEAQVGDSVLIEYTGLLDKKNTNQTIHVVGYNVLKSASEEGIFKAYMKQAKEKVKKLSLDEKIGQMLLVRVPDSNAIETIQKYHIGGYLLFAKDFANLSESDVKMKINEFQNASSIPLLTAVDEEGGSVVRVSSNPQLRAEKFKSSQELYNEGGLAAIKTDTIDKSLLLSSLGLNLNLAPVVDVATDSSAYIYNRTLGQNATVTSSYAKTVIEASKGTKVSYALKHFPGYGNNTDTHTGSSLDNRTLESIMENDILPFKSGIEAGAEAVLISHNTVTSIDSSNPASLSSSVHDILRNDLHFTGVIITDDLDMGATSSIDQVAVKAVLAGNDILITTDFATSFQDIKSAVSNGTIKEEQIDTAVARILAWKYYKGLLFDNQK